MSAEVITRKFDPHSAGQTACEEGVDVVLQVVLQAVDNEFGELLWVSSSG